MAGLDYYGGPNGRFNENVRLGVPTQTGEFQGNSNTVSGMAIGDADFPKL